MTLMPTTTPSDRSSQLSPATPGLPSQWARPRSPLPPERLAKLANALGISTPVPHGVSLSPNSPVLSAPNTSTSLTFPDNVMRRSPTPSATSLQAHTPTASSAYSKYLLHVIPPTHLPHEFSDPDDLTLAPPSASGYHTQFRRGVMVPVYPTLQSQMGAIAREYALPSTLGMVLYLVATHPDTGDEPGPRISEDIWKHIWTRVLRAEKDELASSGPRPLGLGFSVAGRSSPGLLQDIAANGHPLKPIMPPSRADTSQSVTPSPSTPSNSAFSSQSEIEPPESASSVAASGDIGGTVMRLPGLSSPSLIPILAKVEFDIDRRKAGWYETWIRSRKMQQAKRAESRAGGRSRSRMGSESGIGAEDEEIGTKQPPIDLELLSRINADGSPVPSFLLTRDKSTGGDTSAEEEEVQEDAGYQQLSESPVMDVEPGEEEDAEEREASGDGDPLAEVFGTDAETWAEVHAEAQAHRSSVRDSNPNVVDLALDAAAISNLPDDLEEDEREDSDEEGEVTQLLNAMNRPSLTVGIPSSPPTRKHVPPPLNLAAVENLLPPEASPAVGTDGSSQSAQLPYLGLATPSDAGDFASREPPIDIDIDVDDLFKNSRSPQDEKREGAIFDDLNLGLDPTLDDYDENDPHDRRRSQYIMSAQLDEIEKTLAQLSPRKLNAEILNDDEPLHSASSFSSFSPDRGATVAPRVAAQRSSTASKAEGTPSWPAVPHTQLNASQQEVEEDTPMSPPRFAFNGISTEPPKMFQARSASNGMSDESLARKRAMEEDNGLYPALDPSGGPTYARLSSESPIIPLSPDPFGRFPSRAEAEYLGDSQQVFLDELSPQPIVSAPDRSSSLTVSSIEERPVSSRAPSSRFSIDSVTSEEVTQQQKAQKSSASLMSVKSIRRLWRKSGNKGSISNPPPQPESGRSSPNMLAPLSAPIQPPPPPPPPVPSGRKRSKSISKQQPQQEPLPPSPIPPSPTPSPVPTGLQVPATRPAYKQLHFNQDSPYPIHPMGRSPPAPSPRELSPALPPLPSTPSPQPSPVPSPQPQPAQRPPSVVQSNPDRNSVRKSILKSWKSASGLHGSKSSISRPPSASGTPRSSNEQQSSETTRKRRPSVLDIATTVMRNSMSSSVTLNGSVNDIPPSPAIPEQFMHQMSQSRSASRQSQVTLNGSTGDNRDSKGRPSMSSSSASSPPRVRSPFTATSPPRNGNGNYLRKSVDSFESRPSLDVSQFEIVSPKKDAGILESTLSYPYHALDHSMTSHE